MEEDGEGMGQDFRDMQGGGERRIYNPSYGHDIETFFARGKKIMCCGNGGGLDGKSENQPGTIIHINRFV